MEKHFRNPETGAEVTAINQVQADAFEAAGFKPSKMSKAMNAEFASESAFDPSQLSKMQNMNASQQNMKNDTEFSQELGAIEQQAQADAQAQTNKMNANAKKTK